LRLKFVTAVWFAVCGTALLAAQTAPPSSNPVTAAPATPHIRPKSTKLSAPAVAPAIFDATSIGSPIALNKSWRVGITSDLAASLPTFDDSKWAVRDAKPSIGEVPDEDVNEPTPTAKPSVGASIASTPAAPARRYAWFRLHVQLAPHHGPLALLIELPVTHGTSLEFGSPGLSPELFVNGKQIQPDGPHSDTPE